MADNFNHNLEVLNRNIELLADKMSGSDTFDSGNIAHLGNFVQSLSDLKSLGKGEILNTKAVEQQIHSSLMGLQSSITGDTKQIVQNIQSQMSQIFSATTDDFGKHLTHIGNGISTLEKSYSTQIVNMQRNGVNVVRTHIDQGIRDFNRNIAQTNQAYMDTMQNGLIALSGRVAQQRNSMKGASLDFTLSVDSIMKDMEASSSRSISSRKAALKRIASEYKAAGHIQDDVFQSLTASIGAIKGSDKAYRAESSLSAKPITDQFRGVVQNLFDSLSTESRNYIGKNRGQQVTRGIASYGTDGFYGGSTATLRQQVLGSSKELSDFLSGKYLSQRIANVGGNQSAIKNRFDLNAQFDSVMKTFEKMGIGTYWKPSASGKTMDIGFFDESKIDQIFSQRGKSVQADWSKMAKITMGIPGQHGNVVAGGMNLADVFLPMLSTKNGLPSATMSTLSEQIWQSVFGGLDSKKFLQHLKSGDITKATSYLSRLQSNVIEGMATNATYGAYSSDSIADITKGMYAGSSPMRRLYRSNTAKFANSLESAYNAFYKPTSGKSMSSSQLEQMMDYVFARFTGDAQANMILGDKDHKWITTAGGTRYLDTLADLLKTAFPNAGISSKKELAYLTGDIAAVDSNALSPFHVLNPGMNRGISQGANSVRRAHQAKGMLRSPLLRSQMAVNLGENYDSLERQIVTMAEATDSEIRGGLSQYYGQLAQAGNIHELTQLYGRHIGKVPKNLKGNATALATALSNRQMPSTLEGGAITSTDIAKSFEGYRDATATITYDDLMKLGLTQTPTEANSVLNLNQMDAQRLIGHSKHGVRLSDGTVLRGGYRGKGYRGDLPTSVSLMSDGSYQLAYQEFMPYNRFVKMVSTDGDRLTLNSSLTSGEMSALNQYLGISGKGADVFIEPTKTDPRKLAGLTQKKYEEVFQRINSGIQSGTIKSQDLSDFIQGDTTLSKFLSYDGKYLWSKAFNSSEFKSVFDEKGAQDLFNTYSQTGAYARLIQRFLPQQFSELMSRNIGATSLNKADEYEYFDPIGSVSKEVAQRSGHYKQTPLERQSIAREIGMMSAMGINTDALSSVLTSYGSLGESSELTLNKTAQSLREAYNKTIGRSTYSSEVNPASTIVNDLIYGKGGTLNQGDFATTILGNAYQNFLQNGNDTRLDLGRTFTIRGEKGGTLNLNSVAVPTLEPTLNVDGTYTPHALEGKYRALVKSLQALDEIEATSGDVDSIAREQAYGTAQAALEDVVASQYNTLYYKKGAIQSGLNNTQLTNATASKATAGNFSNPEVLARLSNSVVLSNADLTRMMSTGEGGDLNQNIQRLSWMAKRMFSGDESVLKKINTWTSQGTTDAEQSLIQQILTATDINNANGQGLQGFFHRNPLIAGDDNKFINVRSSGALGRGLMYADQGLATAVNLDYDGDTNYTALPLFGASNEAEFNAAADSFDKMQRVTARVNDILRENAYSDYSTKTGRIAEGSDVKMSEAISSFYANDGRDSFLQDILSKKNFKFVGQLDNYAKAMYSAYSSNMMDELSGDPTKAGRSILARSFFEQLTQDSISSKKVGERIRSKIGKGATDAQIEALYLQELQGLQSTIDLAKGMGRNGVSATDLVNGVSNSGVLDFSKGNRVTHRALATVESMLREVYGNDSQAYRAKMEELGIWDSRFDRAYGLRDGEEDTTASQRGIISSQQYAKILEARNAEFAAIHPGQSIVSEGYAQLSKGGQYEKTADQIVDNLRARVRKAEQITEQFTGSPVGATNGANIGRTLGIRELVAINNPKAGFSDYSAATSKLIDGWGNLGNSEFLSQMMSADSDTARASLMGFSNTRDFNAFKQYLVKKVVGDTVHKAHETGSVTDNNYYRSLFGTGSFTDDGQGIGLFKALGLSQTEIDNLHSGIAYRYGAQSEVNRKINADMSEGSITSLQEAGIKANIGGIDLKGISDLITFGQVGDKKIARLTDYKNIGHDPGIREFEQLFLNEAVLRQMQKDITGISDADAAKKYGWTPEAIAQLRQVEDFESILNATDNKGNTRAYRRTNAWVADEAVEQIAKAGKTGILTADQREAIMSMYSASPLDSIVAEQGEQGAQMARKYGQHLTNDEMLSQYRAFMGEKLAIDQNYATVKAQLSGTAERDPEYKVLQKRLESLQALREEYSSINYYRDGDNLVRAKGENIDAWTEGFDNDKPREIIQQFEQLNQGAEVHNKTMMQMSNINNRVTKTLAGLSSQFKGMLSYYAMYGVVQKIIGSVMQTFQKFIQTVKELDQALVNLEIVTTKSRNELQESIEGYMDIAHNMGRTTTEVMSAANDWLRAGYDIEDANLLIQDSLKLSTLGMIDAEKATESLLSTMKGWKLTAEEVSGVVDSLTALDVEYATTAGDIATAMAKGNVSASLAGVDMSNYQAYLTTVLDVSQQSAETVGTAFKTLFARYGNVKAGKYAENYNFGESDSEANDETTKLNDVETVLNKVGIQTRATVGEFREMDEVLDEVAEKWSSFDKVTKNAITSAMAGTRQREVLNVLFENYDEVENAREVIANSEGSADKKYEAYNNSIAASQNRLTVAMEKMANGEGYKDLLVDVYGMLETGVNILGGLLDNLDKIAIATAAILLMTKGGSVLGGISHIAGGYGNFARGFAGGVYNTIGGIGNFLMHPISTIKGGVGNLSQFANAQQIYQYNAAVNRGAHKLGYADINNLGLGLNGAAFTGNVFSPTDLNASTRFLTNSSVYGLFGGMKSGQINSVFNNALMGLNNPQIAQAYNAYSQALQQGVTDETQLSNLRQQLKQSFANTDMASDQAAQQLLEFSAQTGMTGDQLAGSALIMRQNAVNGNVPMAGTPAKGLKGFTQSNLGRQLGNVGMMAGSMVGMMGTSAAIKEAGGSDTTAMVGSMAVSGIAMLGPWGALIAGVLGAGGALYSWLNESQEEILEAAQKAEESLSDLKSSVEESQKNVTQLESQETRWNELIKGVDSASGKNISLSDAEWSEYQEILSSIIDSRNDLYASYDEEGNIIAKNAQSVMNLNDAMSESIKVQQEKLRAENEQIATKKDEDKDYTQAKILRGQYVKMFKEYQEDYEAKEDSAKMLRKDADKQWEKFTKKWTKDKAEADPKGYAADLRKWSMDYGMVASAAEDEFQEFAHKVQLEINDLMKPYMSTMLQGNESYVALDKTSQSFILDQIFGSYNINPSQSIYSGEFNSQEQWNKDYEKYLNYANVVSEWAKNNPLIMQQLAGYNFNTSGATASSQYEQALYQMLLSNFSEEDIPTVLKHMGFSNIKVDNGNIQADTQYEYFTNLLLKEGFDSETLKSLTGQELSTLYRTRDNFKGFSGDIVELRNQLKELTLGETANASEYFASLASELGLTTANTKELIEAIQNGDADGSFGLSKLKEIADSLNLGENGIETLIENISILGDINTFGQTSKSLSEIETQFEHIDAISQDLSDNGMISAENLETLINEFPELVQYVDDFDTLLSKLQDMGDLKTIKIQASIAGSIADSDKVFEEFISKQLGDNLDRKIDLGMFGNLSNLQTMTKNLYDIDEQGNATLKSFYQNMALRAGQTDSGTYADNSWAKFVAENRYGIDTSKGTVDEVNQKLYQAMKSSAISSGLSEDGILDLKQGGLTQLLQLFQNQMTNNPQYLLALQGVATAEANLKAGKAAKQVENEEWEKNLSKAISDLKDDYDSGRIGIDNYIAGMEQLSKHSKITKEQLKELQESVEDAKFEKLSKQFEDGAISASKYRSELSALMKQNAFGSDDYNKYRDAFLSTFDSELDKLDGQKSLLYEKDYSGQRSLLNRENVVLTEKLAALEAAGLKNTKDYLDVLERIKTNKEEQLEINKQELEYQKEQLDNTMGAYNTLADYAIKQLEKERDLVEERYDEEIDKLQEVNDQKERSIELTKLQQELENAQKELSRVYVGGIGFTYQANQAKIDEAEKNLEDYLSDRKISDLGNAKERDLKYYEDQIDFWNEVKEMVEDVQTLASTEDAIRQLIKDGILPSGATIPSSLETLRQNVKLDSDGHVLTLGKKFDVIRTQYLDNAKRLWKVNAEWETNLKNIANVMSGFKSSDGMIEQFTNAFKAGAEALDITVEAPENTVDLTQLQNDLAQAKAHLNTIQSNLVNIGKVTVGNYVSKTKSDGVWGNGKYFNKVVTDTVYNGTDGKQYYQFTNSENGNSYLVKTSDIQYDAESGNFVVKKGAAYYNMPTFSSGLEAGVMAHTGLAMLHGTPQKPEYVLNNDQAWTLLKNFATLSLPAFDRKSSNKTINYQFYGDLHLPNVQDPSTFFEELLRQSSSQFNITQSEY